jgi:hypothetical protein
MLESDNKENSKKEYRWENMERCGECGESKGDPRWGVVYIFISLG